MRLLKPDGGVFQIKSTAEKSEEMPQPGFQMLVIEFSPKQRSVSICVFFSLQQRQIAFKPLQDW
jgi:hypothetical protein